MEALREVHNGVDPVTEASHTLHPMEDRAVAEDELVRLTVGPGLGGISHV